MESSSFFDAQLVEGTYDREYTASDFAAYFASLIDNGVFFYGGNARLAVYADTLTGMGIQVDNGMAWINGYRYENDALLTLTLDTASGTMDRIDAVVVRWSLSDRTIRMAIKTGTPASSPQRPTPQRDGNIYELIIAYVEVDKGVTDIKQKNVIDARSYADVCGWVVGMVDQVDVSTVYSQFQAGFASFQAEKQAQFDSWLATLQNALDGDTAGHLQNEIDTINNTSLPAKADAALVQALHDFLNTELHTRYDTFNGAVLVDTTSWVLVSIKNGQCNVCGTVKPNAYIPDYVAVLDAVKVPPPQYGIGIYTVVSISADPQPRPLKVGIGAGGSLRMEYGSANTYQFTISYPVDQAVPMQ